MPETLRILTPFPHVTAFYDGRVEGMRFAEGQNWVDEGALSVGIASYAVHAGEEAIVYDTHVTLEHASAIRAHLEAEGIRRFTVVLSHWHLDHIAGNAAFADCEIVANRVTAAHLAAKRAAIECGTLEGPPAIAPLVMPGRLFDGALRMQIGPLEVELIQANIHSDDATVLWLPQHRILLAGDTMEDTVTFVGEPEHFDTHLADLDRLWALDPRRILPAHGCPEIIAGGGYGKTFIRATQQYIRALRRCRTDDALSAAPLSEVIAGPLDMGWVKYFPAYEEAHRMNVSMARRAQ
jgi:glyoxylase-like metal-dependent hydrolase (beta-lactamase superfamily II)